VAVSNTYARIVLLAFHAQMQIKRLTRPPIPMMNELLLTIRQVRTMQRNTVTKLYHHKRTRASKINESQITLLQS